MTETCLQVASTCSLQTFQAFYCCSNKRIVLRKRWRLWKPSGVHGQSEMNSVVYTHTVFHWSAFLPEIYFKKHVTSLEKWLGSVLHFKLTLVSACPPLRVCLTVTEMVSALTLINTFSFCQSTAVCCVAGCCRHGISIWNYKNQKEAIISLLLKNPSRINFFCGFAHLKFHLRMVFPVEHNLSPYCDRKTPNNKQAILFMCDNLPSLWA